MQWTYQLFIKDTEINSKKLWIRCIPFFKKRHKLRLGVWTHGASGFYLSHVRNYTAQKMNFPFKDLFSKYEQISMKLWIWSHLPKKSLSQWNPWPDRGVSRKKCSENMRQIYRKTPMPKYDFNKVAKQLYWNHISAWVFSCKFVCIFSEHLLLRTPLDGCFWIKLTILRVFVNILSERIFIENL